MARRWSSFAQHGRAERSKVKQATGALLLARRERTHLIELLRQLPAAVTLLRGPDLVIEFAHPLVRAAVGDRPLEGKPLLEAIPEFADQPHVARMRRVFATGETSHETVLACIHDPATGERKDTHWQSTYQPIRDENGAIARLLLFDLEVTKEVEQRRRLELLQEMTSALSRAHTVEEVARIVVDEGTAKLGMPRGGLWQLSADGQRLDLLHDKGYSPALRVSVQHVSVDSGLPLARVLTTKEVCWVTSRAQYAREYGAGHHQTYPVRTSDETSFFCAPLIVDGEAVGCVSFHHGHRHEYGEEEKRLIEAIVDQCALALHRAQLLASDKSAREAAERDERRFRAIFEQSLDGIILTDDDMQIVDANPAACAILRRTRDELIGHPGHEFMPVADRSDLDARAVAFRRDGRIAHEERGVLLPDGTVRLIEMSASAHVVPGLHLTTFRDIDDRKRAEDANRLLEEAGRMFASSLDPEKTLAAVARLAVPRLADWAAIDTLEPDGSIRRVAIAHVDPEKVALAVEMQRRRPPSMANPTGVAQVIRTGQPSLVPHVTDEMLVQSLGDDPEYLALVREIGLVSVMILALPVHGKSRGAITFAFAESRRQFNPQDLEFAKQLARRAGAAFENALAYDDLVEANRVKDLFLGRARNLQTIASQLVTVATIEDAARVFARTQRSALGAVTCALYLLEGEVLHAVALDGIGAESTAKLQALPLAWSFPPCVACREARAVWVTSPEDLAGAREAVGLVDLGLGSIAALPLSSGERRIGAIAFGFATPHSFDDDERDYLVAIANLWGQAIRRVRLVEAEREALIRSRTRADRLYKLTTALASSMTTASVVETFREHGPLAVSSSSVAVTLLDDAGALDPAAPAATVARDCTPMFFASWAMLPLVSAAGDAMGVVSFDFDRPTVFDDDSRQLLAAVADQCAVALDRARAYEAEAVALRKKDEFLAMLGHELRNPLAPILTATSLIRLRGVASERELGILDRQGRHLVRLVDDLLDISRITSGKLTLRREPIEISGVIAQAIESARKGFEDKRLRIVTEVPALGLVIEGDGDRLVQVITNLLVNAAKFTPPHRSVYITASARDGHVVVEVRDEGEGIAPELLPHVFDLFAQGRQASDRRDGGLGLGLAIARSIIAAHGGAIEARSERRNHGATIALTLPLAPSDAASANGDSAKTDRRSPVTGLRKGRVLVVDDNIDGAEMLADYLGDLGYETSIAFDGVEGLRVIELAPPDVAIIDIGLPGMDGYELAGELRSRLGERAPALIALTGYAQSTDRERALTNGFRAHFAKPVDIAKLADLVADLVS